MWMAKPVGEFYPKGTRVRFGNSVFLARWDTDRDPSTGKPTDTGWYFVDEIYDAPTGPMADAKVIGYIPTWRKNAGGQSDLELYEIPRSAGTSPTGSPRS